MLVGRIYTNNLGWRHADFLWPNDLLGDWLRSDLQGSKTECDDMLAIQDSVLRGDRNGDLGTGNAYTVIIDKDGVSLINEYLPETEAVRKVSNEDFRAAIVAWRKFLEDGQPIDFPG